MKGLGLAAAAALLAGPALQSGPGDVRRIHVSASAGNDAADGLAPQRAVRSFARAKALLRPGAPDRLLLKAGDAWDEPLGRWTWSGRSRAEPLVVEPYGDGPRPLIRPAGRPAVHAVPAAGTSIEHVVFRGLDFYEARRDPDAPTFDASTPPVPGFFWTGEGNDVLIEDCRFRFFKDGLVFQKHAGRFLTDIRLRRCIVTDSWSTSSHAQGIYAEDVDSLLIEECVFDRNGWNPKIPGATRTMFNHHLYIQSNCRRVAVRGNILARAASHAVQLRPGGRIEGNLMIRNAIGVTTGGEEAAVDDNAILESDDITPELPRGWGIAMQRHPKGARYRGNLLLKRISAADVAGLSMSKTPLPGAPPVVVADNVVWQWASSAGGLFVADADRADVKRSGNIVEGKDDEGRPVRLVDAGRSIDSFLASRRASPGLETFLATVRARGRGEWDPAWSADAVIRHLKAGFTPAR